MIKIFKTFEAETRLIEKPEKNCWISMIAPLEPELASISQRYGIDLDDLRAALDPEERSRLSVEDNYTLILVDVPTVEERNGKNWYVTLPLGILLTPEAVITVCLEETPVLDFFKGRKERIFSTHMKTRFILQILYRNDAQYLSYLRQINKQTDLIEEKLHVSSQNRELIELMELEKSLVYFTTSLRANEVVLEKLLKTESVKQYPEDADLLEDVIIENRQAIEMANIYSGILSGMMDAYASVISNNLNIVMKFLAIVTIVLSVPTMIFSAYGMNVSSAGMPFADSPFGFAIILLVSIILSVVVALIFALKKWRNF